MNPLVKKLSSVSAVLVLVLAVSACSPEQASQVYPQEVTGLTPMTTWSNGDWNAKVLPEGWIVEPVFGMRDASFRVLGAKGAEADVSISRLPLKGGTLASNVNRWRVQAGLEPWQEADVLNKLAKFTLSNHEAFRMTFLSGKKGSPTIYGIIMEEGEQRIFIKFSGPAELMDAQTESWNLFVANLEMTHAH